MIFPAGRNGIYNSVPALTQDSCQAKGGIVGTDLGPDKNKYFLHSSPSLFQEHYQNVNELVNGPLHLHAKRRGAKRSVSGASGC